MLPQVLVGLGALSLLSAGCLFWLERLQPLFVCLAAGGMVYQGRLVWKRPGFRRTRTVMAIFIASVAVNMVVLGAWIWLWFRYR
ncbi:MAG: hypothetical protein ACT4P5_23375 [Armatimonadota bacterium]